MRILAGADAPNPGLIPGASLLRWTGRLLDQPAQGRWYDPRDLDFTLTL